MQSSMQKFLSATIMALSAFKSVKRN